MNQLSALPRVFMAAFPLPRKQAAAVRLGGRVTGVTLVELLVAIFIFAILAAIAMGGYNEMMKQSDIVNAGAGRTRQIQQAMQRLNMDFTALEPRPVREPLGDALQPALRADSRSEQIAELTHSGWSNPAGVSRSTLQRVAYRLENTTLVREYWLALDRTMDSEPERAVMLERVKRMELRFMDNNRTWHEQWPPLGYSAPDGPRLRPIAVEITIELEDWGELKRLVEVSG